MRLYSWNVNGFRAAVKKGFWNWFASNGADVVCLQETRVRKDQLTDLERHPDGYTGVWNPCRIKPGYSGVAVFHRREPKTFQLGLPGPEHRGEGRLIHLEYPAFHLFNVYFPNGRMSPERLAYKLGYYEEFLRHVTSLASGKPVLVCGDFNTAHKEIDLANPKRNATSSGFLPEERAWMDRFIEAGFTDTLRLFTQEGGQYTWWSNFARSRERNVGWRLDYFFASAGLVPAVQAAWIEPEVSGSDHCPVGIELDLSQINA